MPGTIPLLQIMERSGAFRPASDVEARFGLRRGRIFEYPFIPDASAAKTLEKSRARVHVVCDSSAFRREHPEQTREILSNGTVWIAKPAIPELLRLRNDPTAEALGNILFSEGQLVETIQPISLSPSLLPCAEHYIELLRLRKQAFNLEVDAFERAEGRPPTENERARIRTKVAAFGARAARLAAKHEDQRHEAPADECAVVLSVFLALTEDRDVILLTDDLDLYEQFYKFTSLVRDDYASHLLARDYLTYPRRYGERISLSGCPEASGFIKDDSASFIVKRPYHLDYLFSGFRHTRSVTVMRVREPGPAVMWIMPYSLLDFLAEKARIGRNTDAMGHLNSYISVPMPKPKAVPPGAYAFFLSDADVTLRAKKDPERRVIATISRSDIMRTFLDAETLDQHKAAANIYETAVHLNRQGRTSESLRVMEELLRRARKGNGGISALGGAQAQVALAQFQEDVSPLVSAQENEKVIRAYAHAVEPRLVRMVAQARLNKGLALLRARRPEDAIKEWDLLECQHAGSRTEELSRCARLAGFNRTQAHVMREDNESAIAAYRRQLIQLGIPPSDFTLFGLTQYGLFVLLLKGADYAGALQCCSELTAIARSATVGVRVSLLLYVGRMVSLVNKRDETTGDTARRLLTVAISANVFPASHIEAIAATCADMFPTIRAREILDRRACFPIGPQCLCCPVWHWARVDLLKAHFYTARGMVNGAGIWFRRVVEVYTPFSRGDAIVRDVVVEADRLATVAKDDKAYLLLGRRHKKSELPDDARIVLLKPDGSDVHLREMTGKLSVG